MAEEAYEEILVEKKGHVEVITLNVPEKLNPITFRSLYEIIVEIERAELDDEVRCIVFTGAGRGFSSGADLSRAAVDGPIYRAKLGERAMTEYPGGVLSYAIQKVGDCRKPTIAAVNGVAVAAGLALILACDIRMAAEKARFSTIFTKRAMVVHAGMSFYLPRVVGVSRALELLWTDRFVMSDEAKEIGLVSSVHEADELMPAAMELAEQIAAGPDDHPRAGQEADLECDRGADAPRGDAGRGLGRLRRAPDRGLQGRHEVLHGAPRARLPGSVAQSHQPGSRTGKHRGRPSRGGLFVPGAATTTAPPRRPRRYGAPSSAARSCLWERMSAQGSPTSAMRAGALRIVKSVG